jgi:UDP-N-acetylglucosamine/UDP-N-acetylgalactosamine diphosphorylase
MIPSALKSLLQKHDQLHLVAFWDELTRQQQSELAEQIQSIDFAQLQTLAHQVTAAPEKVGADRATRATAPSQLIRLPASDSDQAAWQAATQQGEQVLAAGQVGVVLVAGGQGTRLGFDHPKGMFPIGPISECPLFRILVEQVIARSRTAGVTIPYFIMTSEATHAETVEFFAANGNFGLAESSVHFFMQGNMPAVERTAISGTHRILLADKHRLATSPDGHGGILAALSKARLLEKMKADGIEHLYYHQVDNPTAIVCDPAFIGFHVQQAADISTKVVKKVSVNEKMGAVVEVDGQTQIIEYSELTGESAGRTDAAGNPVFWAGNTAIHCFRREFLDELVADADSLPFHLAKKNMPHINEAGAPMNPDDQANPNAIKFERFIFDALPAAKNALVVEADRDREFNPVKNRDGADSPTTAKAALVRLGIRQLQAAGYDIGDRALVEVSPLVVDSLAECKVDLTTDKILVE